MTISNEKLKNSMNFEENDKFEKIFDKEGKNNMTVDISHGISLESLSVNVYKIGDNYGL